jgi:anti-sigma factor RsiW
MMAADRKWFAAHPGAVSYVRPITRAEINGLRMVGSLPGGWDAAGDVEVTQLAPGVRARRLAGAWMFPRGGVA